MQFKRPIAKLKASEQTLTELVRGRVVKKATPIKRTTKKVTKKSKSKSNAKTCR